MYHYGGAWGIARHHGSEASVRCCELFEGYCGVAQVLLVLMTCKLCRRVWNCCKWWIHYTGHSCESFAISWAINWVSRVNRKFKWLLCQSCQSCQHGWSRSSCFVSSGNCDCDRVWAVLRSLHEPTYGCANIMGAYLDGLPNPCHACWNENSAEDLSWYLMM